MFISPEAITTTPAALVGIRDRFKEAVGQAIADGKLPSGLEFEVSAEDLGLFTNMNVTVTACPVLVLAAPNVVAKGKEPRLNAAGRSIRQVMTRIAGDVDDGTGAYARVGFAKAVLRAQSDMLTSSPAAAVTWAPSEAPAPSVSAALGVPGLIETIRAKLAGGVKLASRDLYKLADAAFGGTQGEGAYCTKDAYEAAEGAVNVQIASMKDTWTPAGCADTAVKVAAEIAVLEALLPRQSRRDADTIAHQQFSTPADYAFAVAWAAGIKASDVVLEPSAGNGVLAVLARNAGATVHVNDTSERRRAVLEHLGFAPTKEDAAQLHNIMAGQITPNVVLMNPPFARDARLGDRKADVAAEHIRAALALLADGGRLVAITHKRAASLINSLDRKTYRVRANVLVSGQVFAAHGTSVETRVLVIDKEADDGTMKPLTGGADTVESLIRTLAPLHHQEAADEAADARFLAYRPTLPMEDARPHPAKLVETAAMAAVPVPRVAYRHSLPAAITRTGILSDAQLEDVLLAGEQHTRKLPSGERRGFYIASGTGYGKGRTIAGIIADSWHQGRRKAIWITKDATKLYKAAVRDLTALGLDKHHIKALHAYKVTDPITLPEGVIVVSHGLLRSNRPGKSRLEQIIAWVGDAWDGVLVMDESHKMGNALTIETEKGKAHASQTALAGIEIQARLPDARLVYVSATGASEVKNLAYMDRLGLYGEGAPFVSKADMVAKIKGAGIAAMEVLARDLKALGRMTAKSLSYADVRYERLVHELTPEQEAVYNEMADGWKIVLENLDAAMAAAGSIHNGMARGRALSALWSANLRFWQTVLISMQMPSLVRAIKTDLANGHASVLQLTSTGEAQMNRALAREGALNDLENLDLSPREVLMQFIEQAFPTVAYEEAVDADGNTITRPVKDSEGRYVESAEARRLRDETLARLGSLPVPEGPLEILLDEFGTAKVAEITGRSRRVVYKPDQDGQMVRQVERRSEAAVLADMDAFARDEKHILVFSGAANTGVDFHAANSIQNKRLRRHYVVQSGWNAKEAEQGFGRTHRSDQAQAPTYILVSTNMRGQLRFLSSIARRLGQLGALTRGQRDATSGLFSETDNVESSYGAAAVRQMVIDLYRNNATVGGMDFQAFCKTLGLNLLDGEGNLVDSKLPSVRQFLNRLLSQRVAVQNEIFADFQERHDELVQAAKDAGTFATGVETWKADRIEIISAPETVYTDPESGAQTQYVHLRAWNHRRPRDFGRVAAGDIGAGDTRVHRGWVQDRASGNVYAVFNARNITDEDGTVTEMRRIVGPFSQWFVEEPDLARGYSPIQEDAAETAWAAQIEREGEWETRELNLICGVLLPVWDRIDATWRVYRVVAEDGTTFLGRVILPGRVRSTLARLGVSCDDAWTPREAMDTVLSGEPVALANGWGLRRAILGDGPRVELVNWRYDQRQRLLDLGVRQEIIGYKTRFFIPTKDEAVMAKVLDTAPVYDGAAEQKAAA